MKDQAQFLSTVMNLLIVDSISIIQNDEIVFEKEDGGTPETSAAGIITYKCEHCDATHLVITFADHQNKENSVILALSEGARLELFKLIGKPPSLEEVQNPDFPERRGHNLRSTTH